MISTQECLYKLDQKLNSLSSFENISIPLEDKLLALNESQIECVLTKIDINNQYHIGFDGFRKRYEDLENLVQPHQYLDLTITDNILNKYSSSLEGLTPKYLLYVNIKCLSSNAYCTDISLDVNMVKHSDIGVLINNSNYKPSFEYRETLATISKGSIEIYSDGTFTPTKALVSYITYPLEFDVSGYEKLDGTQSKDQDSNLPDYLINEIIGIAVRNLSTPTANQEGLLTAQSLLQRND